MGMINNEIWMNTEFTNYEVSNFARVRNSTSGRVLTNSLSKSNGYLKVTLAVKLDNGKTKSKPIEVHRLVAQAFCQKGNIADVVLVVDHIDGNVLNNSPENLQWITQRENVLKRKALRKNPKFTTEQLEEIEAMYSTGISLIKLTEYFNTLWGRSTSRSTYTRIVKK